MNAESVNSFANWLLIGSLIVGAVSTYVIVMSGKVLQNELQLGISQANADAENAKNDAAIANQKAAILKKEAAVARLETEKLKQQFSWRRLNERQYKTISQGLLKIETKAKIILSSIASDPESITFTNDLQLAIEAGNFEVTVRPSMFLAAQPPNGITISGPTKESLDEVAQPFLDSGLKIAGYVAPKQKEIGILIGSRPPPNL